MALMLWRRGETDFLSWSALAFVVLMVAGIIGLREAGMAGVAHWRGITTRHYAWESGSAISLLVALALRGFFPVPGNRYPSQPLWRYREMRSHLGWMALGGIVPVLLLVYGCSLGMHMNWLEPATDWLQLANSIALVLVGWDALLPFYPFNCFNSYRLWQWHPGIWASIALLCLIGIGLP
ncbi:MAG: hypothetical protein JJU32_18220 [Phormidium sp. BM_Day4_Bin.17]|nr:hypothetical protein [Phormidium sp. BM_Day4_Bin.17]UCJ13983.1 MAG: hypothetical protein JWS08_09800 [Phormidium sp. PBR-2020]